VGYVTV